ncbi:MAG TPA: phosphatidylserine decarboxylase [Syntrophales bacterium]|nr:phosphatidylserine decarboxylase [Syntrophales bacterium]
MNTQAHQYIERKTSGIRTEHPYGDKIVDFIYSTVREHAPSLFKALISARMSSLLGYANYDSQILAGITGARQFLETADIDFYECINGYLSMKTLRDIFERKIAYWKYRPMPSEACAIVSPADSRVLIGSFAESSTISLKGKFFDLNELLGGPWSKTFINGDFAIFRLTPEKYHYNHLPVSGFVRDIYGIEGDYHSCNPRVPITVANPYSKNKRVVTIIDTNVEGGTKIGLVAMVEVVALMIGDIVQCYSENFYDDPCDISLGMLLVKGRPKSLFRPGSSTDVLIFEEGKISFSSDIVRNMYHPYAASRYSLGMGRSLVETEVNVREEIGRARTAEAT